MAKKTLKAGLSISEIRRLQDNLRKYQNELVRKCKELCEELSDIGINVMQAQIGESPLGKYVTVKTDITEEKAGCKAILTAIGETKVQEGYAPFNTLLAIEFGAGIYHNKIPNPNASEFGLGVGTFPGQTHAFEDYWFYWNEEQQKWLPTHGVKATMPMYKASMEIQKEIVNKAKEIFGR